MTARCFLGADSVFERQVERRALALDPELAVSILGQELGRAAADRIRLFCEWFDRDRSGPELVRTYKGPKRISAPENARALREVVKTGDFESVLTWVIGLEERRPFAVTRSADGVVVTIG